MTEDQQTLSYVNMVKEDISNKLMNLAIKFICLLTGENCAVVMKASVDDNAQSRCEPESTSMKERQSPVTVHPLPFMTLEGQTKKKIREVTQKIIELMTDEVPIRCHDVTVYFSMEEWKYLEGHKDLYKDVMMEDELDGSRKRNPPQISPPTQNSTQEDLPIPHHNQYEEQIYMNVEFKEEEEEVCVTGNHTTEEKNEMMAIKKEESVPDISTNESKKKNPPQRCPPTQDSTQEDLPIPHHNQYEEHLYMNVEFKEEEEEVCVPSNHPTEKKNEMMAIKKEESAPDISTNESTKRNPPQRCPPTQVSTQEDLPIPHHNQYEEQIYMNVEFKEEEEEVRVTGNHPTAEKNEMMAIKKEESAPDISTNESKKKNPPEGCPCPQGEDLIYIKGEVKEEETYTSVYHPCMEEVGMAIQSNLEGCSSDIKTESWKASAENSQRVVHQSRNKSRHHLCPKCGKSFTIKGNFRRHLRTHTSERPYSCSECGKSFTQKEHLVRHQKTHAGECPFSCSECGKCFTQKDNLVRHQRTHTNERPFLCSECGKHFLLKAQLNLHMRVHTGERPFSCSECGKSYTEKGKLSMHQRLHSGTSPFSCPECGKCFTQKPDLKKHYRIHTGECPFSCTECGKSFTRSSGLLQHQKLHARKSSFPCKKCGICFIQQRDLNEHQRLHNSG